MDPQQQIIVALRREVKMLKSEVEYLRSQVGGDVPKLPYSPSTSRNLSANSLSSSAGAAMSKSILSDARRSVKARLTGGEARDKPESATSSVELNKMKLMLRQYMKENEGIRAENTMAMHNKYLVEMQLEDVMRENQRLMGMLQGQYPQHAIMPFYQGHFPGYFPPAQRIQSMPPQYFNAMSPHPYAPSPVDPSTNNGFAKTMPANSELRHQLKRTSSKRLIDRSDTMVARDIAQGELSLSQEPDPPADVSGSRRRSLSESTLKKHSSMKYAKSTSDSTSPDAPTPIYNATLKVRGAVNAVHAASRMKPPLPNTNNDIASTQYMSSQHSSSAPSPVSPAPTMFQPYQQQQPPQQYQQQPYQQSYGVMPVPTPPAHIYVQQPSPMPIPMQSHPPIERAHSQASLSSYNAALKDDLSRLDSQLQKERGKKK